MLDLCYLIAEPIAPVTLLACQYIISESSAGGLTCGISALLFITTFSCKYTNNLKVATDSNDCNFPHYRDLEEDNLLNPGSDVDIYCLLICFLHLVQEDLDLFRESWNRHKIRTARNMSPHQLYVTGLHNLSSVGSKNGKCFSELYQAY